MKLSVLIMATWMLVGVSTTVNAIPLSLTISDPYGDFLRDTDLLSVEMSFDNESGDYDIFYTTDTANPFTGSFRINVNFRNITLLGIVYRSPDFSDTLNDFSLLEDTPQIQLFGNSAALINWNLGDEIAYIFPGLGGFSTSGALGDELGPSFPDSPMRTAFVTGAAPVPEPSTILLLGSGLAGLGLVVRRRRKE